MQLRPPSFQSPAALNNAGQPPDRVARQAKVCVMSSIISGKGAWLQRAMWVVVAASLSGCFDDGSSSDNNAVASPVAEQPTPTNQPPEVSGTPAATVTAGQTYSFRPVASDADEDFLEFTITNQPAWATFDDEFGVLTGIPAEAHVGESEDITITVTDGKDTRSIGPFKIRVNPGSQPPPSPTNRPPVFADEPRPAATVRVGETYNFRPAVSDADGDVLRFAIANRPAWARFNTSDGTLSGTPTAGNVTTYSNIEISVNDGSVTTTFPRFSIQVQGPLNNPPTITGTPATTVQATQTYTFVVGASDPDGDTLTYSITNRPRWATFSTTSGRLSGTPAVTDVGNYSNIIIQVSDGRASARLPAFAIAVTAIPNRAPTITGTPATSVNVGSTYSFTPTATDPDGETVRFTSQNRPSWLVLDANTGRLSGTPTTTGTFSNIIITATDGRLSTSLPGFSIRVNATTNRAPTISGSPPTSVSVGSTYNFQPTAADADGNPLSFTIDNAPSWATFNAATGRLSGTPQADNAGTFSNVIISVSDGTNRVSLPAFAITVAQSSNGSATLAWTPPTRNTDGTTLSNLTGYRVVYGRSSGNLDQLVQITNAGVSTYTITGLSSGTWYFAVKAYNSAGAESEVSNVGTKNIP
jgi:hypothetical protein